MLGVADFYEHIYNSTPAPTDDVHTAIINNPDIAVSTPAGQIAAPRIQARIVRKRQPGLFYDQFDALPVRQHGCYDVGVVNLLPPYGNVAAARNQPVRDHWPVLQHFEGGDQPFHVAQRVLPAEGHRQVCGRVTTARYSRRTWRLRRGAADAAKARSKPARARSWSGASRIRACTSTLVSTNIGRATAARRRGPRAGD